MNQISVEYELQPEIDKARQRLAEHRVECKAPKRDDIWGPIVPAHFIFQPYDCVTCDQIFCEIVDIMARSRITIIQSGQDAKP